MLQAEQVLREIGKAKLPGLLVAGNQFRNLEEGCGKIWAGVIRIGGCPVRNEEMKTLVDRYPLTNSIDFLCRNGPAFLEPLDDDEATTDEEDDNVVVDEETNALMVFYGGRDYDEA
uniref:Uncharacterized protein n=1 Tax=Solanum tuberosum TaxID=4113 RepID=M1DA02_SOLTU